MTRLSKHAGWGLLYLGTALLTIGLLLADPRLAAAAATWQDVTDCYATAKSACLQAQQTDPTIVLDKCIGMGACTCLCNKAYSPGNDRTTCLTNCSTGTALCAGNEYCDPGVTGIGSTTQVCTTNGVAIVVACAGKCDGGTNCAGCGCLKTTAVNDPAIDTKCRCQYQIANF